jgi:malonate decarboxylase gamma subunit
MNWQDAASRLFPQGHDIAANDGLLAGTGGNGDVVFEVTGSTAHTEIGVDLALAMAKRVLATVRDHPGRPILFLIDTAGQRLRHRDELLGINRYMGHLAKCVELARMHGHRVIALVYDQALSGGFLASGMMADVCAALPDAEIRVMNLPAMARVTRQPEERLRALAAKSPVFAPGAVNYVQMGGIDSIWEGDLAARLRDALGRADAHDRRSEEGLERGGRVLAKPVAARVLSE